jgi:TM2 domain-containing membrane protein YozV
MGYAAVWPRRDSQTTVAFAPVKDNAWPPAKASQPTKGGTSHWAKKVDDGTDFWARKSALDQGQLQPVGWVPVYRVVSPSALQSHSVWAGYLLWIIGFTGAHRFFYGRPLTGALWFFTAGLFLVGWIVDAFLIPSMARDASRRFRPGPYDYQVAWIFHLLLGLFGAARFYQGKWITGLVWFFTGALLGIGWIYDTFTLNSQIEVCNAGASAWWEA